MVEPFTFCVRTSFNISDSPFGLNSSVTALIGQPPLVQPCRLRRAWLELM